MGYRGNLSPSWSLTRGGFHGGHCANVSSEVSLAGKYTAVYFSASWCQPCKKFTPQLVEAYHAAMADGKKDELEVLFVSLDSEEGSFEKYRASMPWPAVGFKDKRRALLQLGLEIKSIPALVVLDPTGNVVTSSGVTDIAMNKTLENVISSKIEAADLGNSIEILQKIQYALPFAMTTIRQRQRKSWMALPGPLRCR